jgi:UDP-N-acetylmuramyl pentapeptide phosphotransferase/UDP-N-acetylglucosamine-1-phosphate transferase
LIAGLATALLIVAMLRMKSGIPMDQPNTRSLHHAPVPRSGGIAIVGGVLAAATGLHLAALPLLIALALAGLSFADDCRGLPVAWRLTAHLLAATTFVVLTMSDEPILASAIAVLAIVWMTNLFNFMDGSDGLAGGMAVIGFGSLAIGASLAGDGELAAVLGSIAAAALAFLFFNFHPARIFLGDAGSIPLGFLAAALGLYGWQRGCWDLWFPPLVFAPFIVDSSVTLIRRLLRGERAWQAHREHYYQRLVRLGWGHRRTASAEYVVMIALAGAALLLKNVQPLAQWAGIGICLGLVAWLLVWVDVRWRAHAEGAECTK